MVQHYVFNKVTGVRVNGQLRPVQVTLNGVTRPVTNIVDYEVERDLGLWDDYIDLELEDETMNYVALACRLPSCTIMENTYGLTDDERHELSANDW